MFKPEPLDALESSPLVVILSLALPRFFRTYPSVSLPTSGLSTKPSGELIGGAGELNVTGFTALFTAAFHADFKDPHINPFL